MTDCSHKRDISLNKQQFEEQFANLTKEFLMDGEEKKARLKQKHADTKDELQKRAKREQEKAERAVKREQSKQKELLNLLDEVCC